MRPQVFLYPQQSILLSWAPWPGWGLPKYLSPPTHSPAYLHPRQKKKRKAFSVIKNISDSRPSQSNNGQTSQCDYRALTVSLLGRQYAWSECGRKAKKSKKSFWSSIPWEDDPHHNSFYAICFTAWSKMWFLTLKAVSIYCPLSYKTHQKIQYMRPYVRAYWAWLSLTDMYLKLPGPPSISHIVKQKDWGVNVHLEMCLVPFRRHFQPSVTVMKTNGLAGFKEIEILGRSQR